MIDPPEAAIVFFVSVSIVCLLALGAVISLIVFGVLA